jgi:hypothetical protein
MSFWTCQNRSFRDQSCSSPQQPLPSPPASTALAMVFSLFWSSPGHTLVRHNMSTPSESLRTVYRTNKLEQNLLSSSCRSSWSCLVLLIATLCASVPRTSFLLASFPLRYEAVPLRCTWCAGTTPFGGAGLDDSATSPSSVSRPCSSTTNLHILSTTCRSCNCLSLSLSLYP